MLLTLNLAEPMAEDKELRPFISILSTEHVGNAMAKMRIIWMVLGNSRDNRRKSEEGKK